MNTLEIWGFPYVIAFAAVLFVVYALAFWLERNGSRLQYARNAFIGFLFFAVGLATTYAGWLGLLLSAVVAILLMITMNSLVVGGRKLEAEGVHLSRTIALLVVFVLGRAFDLSFVPWIVIGVVILDRAFYYLKLRR